MNTTDFLELVPSDLRGLLEKCITEQIETPAFITSIEQLRINLNLFKSAFHIPNQDIYYPVKANFNPAVLQCLQHEGCNFEVASYSDAKRLFDLGVEPARLLFGHPVAKFSEMKLLYDAGVRIMVVDSIAGLQKVRRLGTDVNILVRISVSNEGSEWTLTEKFGSSETEFHEIADLAIEHQIPICGVSFHVGWNNNSLVTWTNALEEATEQLAYLQRKGLNNLIMNIGGGFPAHLIDQELHASMLADKILPIFNQLKLRGIRVIAEPGSFLVTNTRLLIMKVVEIHHRRNKSWVYVDSGVNQGFHWIMSGLKYGVFQPAAKSGSKMQYFIVTGASQDSQDVFDNQCLLSSDLKAGDYLVVFPAGAYIYPSQFYGGLQMPSEKIYEGNTSDGFLQISESK